jgi:catechol 2,3-dioxygenase-like lactoylglutathione lyase family enzyme
MTERDTRARELEVRLDALHHVGITVADLDRSVEFYTALTGGAVMFSEPMRGPRVAAHMAIDDPGLDLRFAMIRINNTILELIEFTRPRGERRFSWANTNAGAVHLAFEVPDIAAAHRRLSEAGMTFVAEPYTFVEEDDAPDVVGATFAYFTDPDGLRLEIFQPAS